MSSTRQFLKNLGITVGILAAALILCRIFQTSAPDVLSASPIFVLAVLLISRFTDGYFWGVLSSVFSVFAVNFAFTYPYYRFNLEISGYLLTFITTLAISLIVSVMNTRIKSHEQMRIVAERERLRADLFRAVSHDLRTPLTSIIGSTGVVLENNLPADKQLELISDVHSEAQWLLRMVENLLAITRVSQNAQPLRLQPEVVEEVITESVIKFNKHFSGIEVTIEQPDEVLFADMEPVLIAQVVTNLLENAVYHGIHTTKITLSIRNITDTIYISVADNGAGIPESKLANIFCENDVSAQRRGADSKRGMGIGLSVCMNIVKAHGGTMYAGNSPEGGAVFTFTLPKKEFDYGPEGTDIDN